MLLVACAALLLGAASVHGLAARDLKQFMVSGDFANQPLWPFCRCNDYSAASQPYNVTLSSQPIAINGQANAGGEHCLTISYLGPSSTPTSCYSALEVMLDKLQFTIQNPCVAAWDVTSRYISVNGELKISGYVIEEYPSNTIVRLSNLRLNKDTAEGTRICFQLPVPCNTPVNFFDTIPVTWIVMESGAHKCCIPAPLE